MLQVIRKSNRQSITLDSDLGSGGEGNIYTVLGEPSLVAKIYREPTEANERKLDVMIANPPDNPTASLNFTAIAWPVDILYKADGSNQFAGFLMPKLTKMLPIHEFYTPKVRCKICPGFNYHYLCHAARNLAAIVQAVHNRGYVIGDVNESNIFINDAALVAILDTDSFQVSEPNNGFVHRCTVGKPEFTPPELQNVCFADVDRTREHDLFGLAVLIFQLLMEGVHPFAGILPGIDDPPQYDGRISAGYFPYCRKRKVPCLPTKTAPSFDILHPWLRDLFVKCFEEGHNKPKLRPDARTWMNALDTAKKELDVCSVNENHRYGKHLTACPWCQRKKKLNFDPFPYIRTTKTSVKKIVKDDTPMVKLNFDPFPYIRTTKTSVKKIVKDDAPMVLIPAGEFQMGSHDGSDDEKPVHTVYLDAFYIDKHEVTNAQYRKFVNSTGYKSPCYWNDPRFNKPDHPVVGISWYDAEAYAEWAGKRLPTEAEWEKAARGGLVGKKYPWGDNITHNNANFNGTGGKDEWEYTSPVGSFEPNGYGLYDMAGNVWEWCADWYDENYYSISPKSNPKGPGSGIKKVLRGGSWNNNDNFLRVACRFHYDPYYYDSYYGPCNIGFRCVQ